jgi:hypothetical protein
MHLSKHLSRLSLHYSFSTSIGRHFVSFLTCISCFYIYLVKYFNLNEKFILLKNSSDPSKFFIKARIGFGLDNFGSDRILNISQLSDYKRPIRCTHLLNAHVPLWAQQHMVDRHYSLNLKPWSARTLYVYAHANLAQKYSVGLQEIFVSRLCSQEENYFSLP